MEEIKLNEVCRTCLTKTGELRDLFTDYPYIPPFIATFTSVQIDFQDQFSQLICLKCVELINQIYNFRQQIEAIDARFRGFIIEDAAAAILDPSIDLNPSLIIEDDTAIEEIKETISSTEIINFPGLEPPAEQKSKFKCQICEEVFKNSVQMKTHRERSTKCALKSSQNEANFKCVSCKESFVNNDDLKLHETVHVEMDLFTCKRCHKLCPTLKSLKRHIRTHFQRKPERCRVCHMEFSETASLTRHYKKHLDTVKEKKFSCPECGQQFNEKFAYNIHLRKHTGDRPFSCEMCGKTFTDKRLLKSHALTHSDTKLYKCDLCQADFTHRSTLITHLRVHTGVRPFFCQHCNKSFKQATHLKIHQRTHTNSKPSNNQCKLCTFSTTNSATLKTHQRTHKCEICKQFFSNRDLRDHYATHTGQKFTCDFVGCMKAFSTQAQLNNHVKTHQTITILENFQAIDFPDYQNQIIMS